MYPITKISALKNTENELRAVLDFHTMWYNEQTTINVNTSGSTGKPKSICIEKKHMLSSARATNRFFNLTEILTASISLSANNIAGMMMLVRVFDSKMKLIVTPTSTTFFEDIDEDIDFSALVPLQITQLIKSDKRDFFKCIIIGGAPISYSLEENIILSKLNCFASYGMTETLSHVALRKLSELKESFSALEGIDFNSENGQLVINAPRLGVNNMKTNDVVELLDSKHFNWLGRVDFVINSGGKKFHPEIIEAKIKTIISCELFIFGQPHEQLGEQICLVLEELNLDTIKLRIQLIKILEEHEMPRLIYFAPKFNYLHNLKIDRKKTLINLKL
jgi:O-succinylbenzoic acid--CoA ligase